MDPFHQLIEVVDRLRGEGGCAWDRAQTPGTLAPHLLEEAHEAAHAIRSGTPEDIAGELGDLLFLVQMIARIHAEQGAFDVYEPARRAAAKMVRRHPHVFGDATEAPSWQAMKAEERDADTSVLGGLPATLPPLLRARRLTERAASVGFDWPDRQGVRLKVDEELAELDEALASADPSAITEEFGDLLFTLVNLGRFLPVPAEGALSVATDKFERRFRLLETECLAEGQPVNTLSIEALEARWQRAKERS